MAHPIQPMSDTVPVASTKLKASEQIAGWLPDREVTDIVAEASTKP